MGITISMNALPAHMSNHVRAAGWQDVLFTGSACPASVSASAQPGAGPNVTPPAPGHGPKVGVAPAETAPAPSASAPAARTENAVLHPASAPASAVAGQAVAATSTQSSGSLPFTGFQALTALLVAATLLGTGVLVRRLSASKHPALSEH